MLSPPPGGMVDGGWQVKRARPGLNGPQLSPPATHSPTIKDALHPCLWEIVQVRKSPHPQLPCLRQVNLDF